jgi:hypothetical protein
LPEQVRGLRDFRRGFNPTLVRFCLRPHAVSVQQRIGFNPTLVRFCLGTRDAAAITHSFNPTLVRFCQA